LKRDRGGPCGLSSNGYDLPTSRWTGKWWGASAGGCWCCSASVKATGEADAVFMADKVARLRIFEDDQGKMNLAPADVGAEFLVVSQFTLYGDIRKGRRPSFTEAAPPERARELYERFLELLRARGFRVESGIFGAKMLVQLENDGPVTLWFDTAEALK